MRKSVLAVVAAVSMIGVSGGALAQSAAPLSVAANVRTGADMDEANDYRGGYILPTLAVLAVIAIIYLVTKSDEPSSP